MRSSKKRSVAGNVLFSFGERFGLTIISLVLTPLVIGSLGKEQYGLWVIFNSVIAYFLLMQFGLSTSFNRFFSEYSSRSDTSAIRAFVSTAFYAMLAIGVVISGVGWFAGPIILKILAPNSQPNAGALLRLLFLGASIGLLAEVYASIAKGSQRFDVSSSTTLFSRSVFAAVVVIMLRKGMGIEAMVFGTLIFSATQVISSYFLARTVLHAPRPNPSFFEVAHLKRMYGFSIKLQMSFIAMWIAQNFDKIILARTLGTDSVATYDIGSRLVMFIREIPIFMFFVFMPKLTELYVTGSRAELHSFYNRTNKLTCALALGAIGLFYPIVPNILAIWLRSDVDPLSVYTFRVLLIGMMPGIITGAGSALGRAMNKPQLETISISMTAIFNVLLSLVLFRWFGFKGVVFGTSLAFFCHLVFYEYLIYSRTGWKVSNFWKRDFALPFFVNAGIAISGLWLLKGLSPYLMKSIPSLWGHVTISILHGAWTIGISSTIYLSLGYFHLSDLPLLRTSAKKPIME